MAMRLSWLGWLLLFVGGLSAAPAPTSVVFVGVANESGYRGALFQDERCEDESGVDILPASCPSDGGTNGTSKRG